MSEKKLNIQNIFKFYINLIKSNKFLKICFSSLFLLALASSALEIISLRFFSQASTFLNQALISEDLTLFLIFVIAFITSNIIRLIYLFFASKFSYKLASLIDNVAFLNLSNLAIQFNNTNKELIEKYLLTSSMLMAPNIFLPFFLFINSIFSTISIVFFLFYLFGLQVLTIFFIILFMYVIYYKFSKLITNPSKEISNYLSKRNSLLLDVRFNFIELYTLNLSENLYKKFKDSQNKLRTTEALINFNSFSPRYFIEICVIFMAAIILYLYDDLNLTKFIFFASTYGYAFLRLLPFIQTSYGSLNTILSFNQIIKESIFILSLNNRDTRIYKANICQSVGNDILIELRDFVFTVENQNKFNPISETIKTNSIYSITGPSGIGKSSLLNYFSLGRSLLPSNGSIDLYYRPNFFNTNKFTSNNKIDVISMGQFSKFRSGKLYEILFDYILYFGKYRKEDLLNNTKLEKLVSDCISIFKLDFILEDTNNPFIDPEKLSGGQAQRVCMARSLISALILNPKLLIWDEPFSSLDKKLGLSIFSNLLNANYNFSIIIVSHLQLKSSASKFKEIKLVRN